MAHEDSALLKELRILTPLDNSITLDNISLNDTALSLRPLLAEVPELAPYTAYVLQVQSATTPTEWIDLNDFVELQEYPQLATTSTLRMKLDLYDDLKARTHVRRFHEVLANPPIPAVTTDTMTTKEPEKESSGDESDKNKVKQTEEQLKKLQKIYENIQPVDFPLAQDLAKFYAPSLAESALEKAKDRMNLTKCLKSLEFSGFNPPPGPRKLAGDLFYLKVITLEDKCFHLTAHVSGFYVNQTTLNEFNPAPASPAHKSHLLLDTLSKQSPSFATKYAALLAQAADLAKRGPLSIESMLAMGGKLQWNMATEEQHQYNLNRAEDYLCDSFGLDEQNGSRDWNEEYQCCRELPMATLGEQIIRNRAIYKVLSEFVQAATLGAMAIVEGKIPPMNPMDSDKAHVYLYNNIFFSQSFDNRDLPLDLGVDEAVYSSANHDLQGVLAYNSADVPGLHTLATSIVDYLGVRMVAQSVIPGILRGEAASKLVYGSVDGGNSIAAKPEMHELMVEAGKKLHIAERKVKSVAPEEGSVEECKVLCGPVEAKGIRGSDDRYYVLDLVRITPRDACYYDKVPQEIQQDSSKYSALLRPELIHLFTIWKQNQAKLAKKKAADEKATEDAKAHEESKEEETPEPMEALEFNPNVFMKYSLGKEDPETVEDEKLAREAAEYLQQVVLPALLTDIRRGVISPADGQSLTETMHSCGINMRYLGRLAELSKEVEAKGGMFKYVLELLEVEMIARSVKHLAGRMMSESPQLRAAPGQFLAELLNALLGYSCPQTGGSGSPSNKKKKKKPKKLIAEAKQAAAIAEEEISQVGTEAAEVTQQGLWKKIQAYVEEHFRYTLSLWTLEEFTKNKTCKKATPAEVENTILASRMQPVALLRRVCQKLGVCIASRTFDFCSNAPFVVGDIQKVIPVVKHSIPKHPLDKAKDQLENGRILLRSGKLAAAYEALQESSALLHQVCGSAHEEAALCCSSLATVLYHAGDLPSALLQQQRAVALYTQFKGMDHHDTAFAHANLALFLHSNAQTDEAVKHMQRAIYLLQLIGGNHLPEVGALYFKLAMMYQEVGHVSLALQCHRESLRRTEFDRVHVANVFHQMALACSIVGGYREAMAYEKKSSSLYVELFGAEDPRTKQSIEFLSRFTERAVQGEKGRKEMEVAAAAENMARELSEAELLKDEEAAKKKKSKNSKKGKKSGGKKK